MMLPQLTLVLGGAASGKSAFAERLACACAPRRLYIATGEPRDTEMQARINAHRARRGEGWRTTEAPRNLAPALTAAENGEVVLLDCATMWLANHMLAGNDTQSAWRVLRSALDSCAAPVIVVSNETGMGVVPENALGRAFRQAQGELNQKLAARAGLVVQVIAGLPQVLKGILPEDCPGSET